MCIISHFYPTNHKSFVLALAAVTDARNPIVFIIYGSSNISFCTTYQHVTQYWISINFEFTPSSLCNLQWLLISVKLVSQMTLLLNPSTILLLFVKIPSFHSYNFIYNTSFWEKAVHAFSVIELSMVSLSIVLNGLNTAV